MNTDMPLLLAFAAMLSGCIALPIPHDRATSPRFYGDVRDVTTGLPIPGASVKVLTHGLPGALEELPRNLATGTTADDGRYEIGVVERRTWFIVFLLPAEGTCGGTLFVSHPEYQEAFFEASQFRGAVINGSCTRYKVKQDVRLKRKI